MTKGNHSFQMLEKVVKWLNKTEGRDKLCKFLQYFFLLLSSKFKEDDYYSLQFSALHQSIKDARKLFRLFKSIIEYQKLVGILLDDDDNWLKVFRVFAQIFFFFYWFFDNISIVCKIRLVKGNYSKYNIIASIFWLLSLIFAIPILYIEHRKNPNKQKSRIQFLDCVKYGFDLLPASKDSKLLERVLNKKISSELSAIGGMVSASITTYEILEQQ